MGYNRRTPAYRDCHLSLWTYFFMAWGPLSPKLNLTKSESPMLLTRQLTKFHFFPKTHTETTKNICERECFHLRH